MTLELCIVADDLTGALDTAAPFATPDGPVTVALPGRPLPRVTRLAVSTESRDLDVMDARVRVAAAGRGAARGDALWFKKVDSVLRGHPFDETAQMMQVLGFDHCVFAPAFPAMGRITRRGMNLVRDGDGWMPTAGCDIAAEFAGIGLSAEPNATDRGGGAQVIVVDAETDIDLSHAVVRHAGSDVLWAGSRGLAEALVGGATPVPTPRIGVLIVGTTHPATRAQLRHCQAHGMGPTRLIDPIPGAANATATRDALRRAMVRLDPGLLQNAALFVVGGDTLTVVMDTLDVLHLECRGEIGPGLPYATLYGGALDGCGLITKSGGFGDRDLLARLLMNAD
ncbi:four-carbon acid sugar kinase family protein [Oceaniglobus indicus]|uniref:four-carbon acid sugar kinase family protein n=1 Tax=Oceaniglobus indicus TaxID=2047749 RepID=UPI000C198C1B|nr:four-carbon acid sugar kinase family protein [Oceaniglobus indicus]